MSMNFKNIAAKVGAIDSIATAKRDPAKLETIFDEVVTVQAFYPLTFEKDGISSTVPVVHFREYPNHYFYWRGKLLTRALFAWAEETGCPAEDSDELPFVDFAPLNEELSKQNLRITISKGKTRSGNPLNRLEIIDG